MKLYNGIRIYGSLYFCDPMKNKLVFILINTLDVNI